MTPEHNIQNRIRAALSPYAVIFRANVGSAYTQDGRYFSTGLPRGFPDLFGFRRSDGKMIFIEVKTPKGRIRPEQEEFIRNITACGAIAGVCRSPEDALRLIGAGENNG